MKSKKTKIISICSIVLSALIALTTIFAISSEKKKATRKPILKVETSSQWGVTILGIDTYYIVYDNGQKEKIAKYKSDKSNCYFKNFILQINDGSYIDIQDDEDIKYNEIAKNIYELSLKKGITPTDLCVVGDKVYFAGYVEKIYGIVNILYEYDLEKNTISKLCRFKHDISDIQSFE